MTKEFKRQKPDSPEARQRNRSEELRTLEKNLGIKFRNKELLDQALTHPSHVGKSGRDNARLEFLGDSVLGLSISHLLYAKNTQADEGGLTKWKSHLVSTKFFAKIAGDLRLGDALEVGHGERRLGPPTPSMLAATFEAVIGAYYLDNGFEKTFKFIEALYVPYLSVPDQDEENYKGVLQEVLQRKYREQPRYVVAAERGPAHARVFEVKVLFRGKVFGIGAANSKKEAERLAAQEALTILGRD